MAALTLENAFSTAGISINTVMGFVGIFLSTLLAKTLYSSKLTM
jgi:tetrahydromethanopterin S-methyltransferase subunit B